MNFQNAIQNVFRFTIYLCKYIVDILDRILDNLFNYDGVFNVMT